MFCTFVWQTSMTGEQPQPKFVYPKNEHVLDCLSYVCAKFVHAYKMVNFAMSWAVFCIYSADFQCKKHPVTFVKTSTILFLLFSFVKHIFIPKSQLFCLLKTQVIESKKPHFSFIEPANSVRVLISFRRILDV